jgi:NADH-quinone oxidoreductase subunit E
MTQPEREQFIMAKDGTIRSSVPQLHHDAYIARTLSILDGHAGNSDGLISILEAVQNEFGYLPEPSLRTIGSRMGWSLVDIYGVATFYRAFSLKPRGKHLVCACLGTACHVRGAPRVVEELERRLAIRVGETTADGQFTLETVNCLGACALGPVVVIDGHCFSKVRTAAVESLLNQARSGLPPFESPAPIATRSCDASEDGDKRLDEASQPHFSDRLLRKQRTHARTDLD